MPSTVADRLTRGRDFSVGISAQTAYGAINASPVFIPVRRTTGKPTKAVGYTQDDSVTTDNQGQQNIQDTNEYSMELSASFSKQSVEWLIQSIHGAETATTTAGTTFAATSDGFTLAAAAYTAVAVGDGIWLTGFANPLINGFYIVATKAGSNAITTTIAPVATEASGATVTMKRFKTSNGDAPTYNALQRRVTDTGAAGSVSYFTIYDAVIDTMSMEVGETGIVKGSAKFVAEREVDGELLISGQTYAAALTDRSLSAVQNIEGFYVDGVSTTCTQKSLSLSIANGYSGDDAAACVRQYARGQFAVTGSAAFRSRISSPLDWEQYYQNGTTKALGIRISHGGGDETFISLPQILTTGHSQADGSNDVASHQVSFGAEGNAAAGATIMIFRNWV